MNRTSLLSSFTLVFAVSWLMSCTTGQQPTQLEPPEPKKEPPTRFSGLDACVLIYSLNDEQWLEQFNPERCRERFAPCSTFKVPLAAMAFDSGTLKDENTLLKWDKTPRMLEVWNKDHSAATWMSDSVVWYSQQVTTRMGRKKVQTYLTRFQYGNQDFSGGLTNAWLTDSPNATGPSQTSVTISAYEQVDFLKKLWTGRLPISKRALELTKKITYLETSPNGFKLYGKTGSGFYGPGNALRLGWFIAYIEKEGKQYLSVVTFNDSHPQTAPSFGGPQAKQMMKDILAEKGLF